MVDDPPLDGVDLVVSERGDLGKPTSNIAWCFDCDSMMLEVHWRHKDEDQWVCFSTLKELGEGVWQLDPNLFL